METIAPFLVGFLSGGSVSIFVLLLSERYNKLQRKLNNSLQANLDAALKKVMTVDYEKLTAIDMQAQAVGQQAWLQIQQKDDQYYTPELSDQDVFDLEDYRLRTRTGDETNA